jgi:hypothetical protein
MIYIIKTTNCTPERIKIGYAKKSMRDRIKSLQTGCPFPIQLIYAKNGSLKDERILHDLLAKYRVSGEWFEWNSEVRDILKLPNDPKPLNPESPNTFLTPRQKQINHLFRKCPTNEYYLYAQTLNHFLAFHQYKEKELLEFPEAKARFIIFENKYSEVVKAFQGCLSLTSEKKDDEALVKFICSKHRLDL